MASDRALEVFVHDCHQARAMVLGEARRFLADLATLLPESARWQGRERHVGWAEALVRLAAAVANATPGWSVETKGGATRGRTRIGAMPGLPAVRADERNPLLRLQAMIGECFFERLLEGVADEQLVKCPNEAEAALLVQGGGYMQYVADRAAQWGTLDTIVARHDYLAEHPEAHFKTDAERDAFLARPPATPNVSPNLSIDQLGEHRSFNVPGYFATAAVDARLDMRRPPVKVLPPNDLACSTAMQSAHDARAAVLRVMSALLNADETRAPVTKGELAAAGCYSPWALTTQQVPWSVVATPDAKTLPQDLPPSSADRQDIRAWRGSVFAAIRFVTPPPRADLRQLLQSVAADLLAAATTEENAVPSLLAELGESAASVAHVLALYTDLPVLEAMQPLPLDMTAREKRALAAFHQTILLHSVLLFVVMYPLSGTAAAAVFADALECQRYRMAYDDYRERTANLLPTWMSSVMTDVATVLAQGDYGPVTYGHDPALLPVTRLETLTVEMVRAIVHTEMAGRVFAHHMVRQRQQAAPFGLGTLFGLGARWAGWDVSVLYTAPNPAAIVDGACVRDVISVLGGAQFGMPAYVQLGLTLGLAIRPADMLAIVHAAYHDMPLALLKDWRQRADDQCRMRAGYYAYGPSTSDAWACFALAVALHDDANRQKIFSLVGMPVFVRQALEQIAAWVTEAFGLLPSAAPRAYFERMLAEWPPAVLVNGRMLRAYLAQTLVV